MTTAMSTISETIDEKFIEAERSSSTLSPIPSEVRASILQAEKQPSKFVRVLTVLAYLLCVSLAAIMLSLYYIFIWDQKTDATNNTESIVILDDSSS